MEDHKIPITVAYKREIPLQTISDMITTAVEGGSNYWYLFNEESSSQIRKYKGVYDPALHDKNQEYFYGTLAEAIITAIYNGEYLKVHDIEDEKEVLGVLSEESIKIGVENMVTDECYHLLNILCGVDGNWDAADADAIFQYFVLGKVVYG